MKQKALYKTDRKLQSQRGRIAGVDEAGVGPLAGPVVAAAVIFDFDGKLFGQSKPASWIAEINDSKKLTAQKREQLLPFIIKHAESFGIGSCSVEEIDALNILQARLLAMKRAVGNLRAVPAAVLVDGNRTIPQFEYAQETIVKGDEKIFSIACASILAKVTRDNILRNLHEQFPQYGFDRHKGYPTQFHFAMIEKHGPCEGHRKSFGPIKNLINV